MFKINFWNNEGDDDDDDKNSTKISAPESSIKLYGMAYTSEVTLS